MKLDVIASPVLLQPQHLAGRAVVVLDVLRATTTMITALHHGAREIRLFEGVEAAASAARSFQGPKLLHGERHAKPPPGFDLGNSPGDFTRERCEGRTLFMTTTNGTGAILAAGGARAVLIGTVANAAAAARALIAAGGDGTLLCAGQRADVAIEDLIGAGAIIDRLRSLASVDPGNDAATVAWQLYDASRGRLLDAFRHSLAVRTELRHGLMQDVEFAAVEDRFDIVGRFDPVSISVKLAG